MSEFTPGPWRTYNGGGDVMADGGHIAHVEADTTTERLANARLIAAAPELHEACAWVESELTQYIEQLCPHDTSSVLMRNRLRAALQKVSP